MNSIQVGFQGSDIFRACTGYIRPRINLKIEQLDLRIIHFMNDMPSTQHLSKHASRLASRDEKAIIKNVSSAL